jgi:peptidyl-dipeptidase Dcp
MSRPVNGTGPPRHRRVWGPAPPEAPLRHTIVLALLLAACPAAHDPSVATVPVALELAVNPADNPLLQPWTGPYGGVPPFDRARPEHLAQALDLSMAELLAEVYAIAAQEAPATFENTIAAMERSGRTFSRVMAVYGVLSSTMSDDTVRAVEREFAPKLAALGDAITQNEALFTRVAAVWEGPEKESLNPEQRRLTWEVYNDFVRGGARLDAAAKARMGEINQELASLYTTFSQNLLHDEETYITLGADDLGGLPPDLVAAAAGAAAERGLEDAWAIVNTRSMVDPFLTSSDRRDLREQVWRAFVNRGDNGGDTDNNALISRILALRAERARLLGYETHAHWRLEVAMAGTPDRAMALMEAVWPAAVARVAEEVAAQQEIARAEGADFEIAPWDYRYYQEKVRKARYDLDEAAIKPYLELEALREGMMWASTELFGLQWRQVEDVPVIHPDVRVWEVLDAEGQHVGLWYFDPYARTGKQSGAWMNDYRAQERFDGEVTTIVSNNSNFSKPPPGEPVLISWDDANTLFHEFGHALHGLLSDVTYPQLAGTSVARDFVEFPSQLNEKWLSTPELLERFARHHETGEPIPAELLERLERARTFNQGFSTTEYLASALIDMKLHLAGATPIDPDAFERETLAAMGMPPQIVMRHRTPQFGHVFSGDGYSAGYYSYLWADTLTADAGEAFVEAGSMYDRATAERLRATVLSVGNTVDPAEAFRAFRGRDVDVSALMRDRGFPVPE